MPPSGRPFEKQKDDVLQTELIPDRRTFSEQSAPPSKNPFLKSNFIVKNSASEMGR